jgi:hypothetical protein
MMAMPLITVGVVIGLVVVGFAVFGAWVFVTALLDGSDTGVQLAQDARQTEAEITEIGRRAQEAILAEALSRLPSRYGSPR